VAPRPSPPTVARPWIFLVLSTKFRVFLLFFCSLPLEKCANPSPVWALVFPQVFLFFPILGVNFCFPPPPRCGPPPGVALVFEVGSGPTLPFYAPPHFSFDLFCTGLYLSFSCANLFLTPRPFLDTGGRFLLFLWLCPLFKKVTSQFVWFLVNTVFSPPLSFRLDSFRW